MNNIKQSNFQQGISMIEILVAISLLTVLFVYLLAVLNLALKISGQTKTESQALFLMQETAEAVRNFRDNTDWAVNGLGVLVNGSLYHSEKTGSPPKWNISTGVLAGPIFSQQIVFYEVRRDASANIVASGGSVDVNSKKAQITISWKQGNKTRQLQSLILLTNWH